MLPCFDKILNGSSNWVDHVLGHILSLWLGKLVPGSSIRLVIKRSWVQVLPTVLPHMAHWHTRASAAKQYDLVPAKRVAMRSSPEGNRRYGIVLASRTLQYILVQVWRSIRGREALGPWHLYFFLWDCIWNRIIVWCCLLQCAAVWFRPVRDKMRRVLVDRSGWKLWWCSLTCVRLTLSPFDHSV